jgi:4'-phosphopantetheinyl transferase
MGCRHGAAAPVDAVVDVWSVALAGRSDARDLELLSPGELTRAARLVFTRDRERFVGAHAALRRILSTYTGTSPDTLEFSTGPEGRPALVGAWRVDFNQSHSGDHLLIAVAECGPVGVDMEVLRTVDDRDELADRFFTVAEASALGELPIRDRDLAFLTCWTRKEACLKALGVGLTVPTSMLQVGIGAASQCIQLRCMPSGQTLRVRNLEVGAGIVAAIATAGDERIRLFHRRDIDLRLQDAGSRTGQQPG